MTATYMECQSKSNAKNMTDPNRHTNISKTKTKPNIITHPQKSKKEIKPK